MGRYIKGNIDQDSSLGTLAAQTAVVKDFSDTVNERSLVSSVKAVWSLSGVTIGDNIGPVLVGLAHSDYSQAEIEAWIEHVSTWDEGDKVAQETANRFIRKVGILIPKPVGEAAVLNDGKPVKTKLNWILNQGQTLQSFAYNLGTSAFATTDPNLNVNGHANLWPR